MCDFKKSEILKFDKRAGAKFWLLPWVLRVKSYILTPCTPCSLIKFILKDALIMLMGVLSWIKGSHWSILQVAEVSQRSSWLWLLQCLNNSHMLWLDTAMSYSFFQMMLNLLNIFDHTSENTSIDVKIYIMVLHFIFVFQVSILLINLLIALFSPFCWWNLKEPWHTYFC